MVYFKSRNYEGAIDALQCAVKGCGAELSCSVRECDDTVDPAIKITGMPLSDTTVVYYYTYASALAGMSRSYNNFCQRANEVMAEIRAKFSADAVIMEIISPSEDICRGGGSNFASATTATAATGTVTTDTAGTDTAATVTATAASTAGAKSTATPRVRPTATATPTLEPSPSPTVEESPAPSL
jgi:hypothetical protein